MLQPNKFRHLYFLLLILFIASCKKEAITPNPTSPKSSLTIEEQAYFIDHGRGLILSTFDLELWQAPTEDFHLDELKLDETYAFLNTPNQLKYGQAYQLEKDGKEYQIYFTKLPLLNIQTANEIVDEPKVRGKLELIAMNEPIFESEIGIEIRGGSSQKYDKKSYGFELLETDSEETKKASLLGLRSDDDWILDAMFIDPYRMRNLISHQLWQDISSLHYQSEEEDAKAAVNGKHVEVFVNGEYLGVYVLMEKVDRKLLQLKKPKEETRGELYKGISWGVTLFERLKDYDNSSRLWDGFEFIYPKENISTDWKNLHDLAHFIIETPDQTFQEEIDQYWDVENAIDYFIFLNLLRAWDNRGKNIYIARYKQNSPYFYTPWDLDATWGLFWDGNNDDNVSDILKNGLFERLIDLDAQNFNQRAKERWQVLRQGHLSKGEIKERFNKAFKELNESAVYEREQNRWQITNSPEDIDYLHDWISRRLIYLDNYFQ